MGWQRVLAPWLLHIRHLHLTLAHEIDTTDKYLPPLHRVGEARDPGEAIASFSFFLGKAPKRDFFCQRPTRVCELRDTVARVERTKIASTVHIRRTVGSRIGDWTCSARDTVGELAGEAGRERETP